MFESYGGKKPVLLTVAAFYVIAATVFRRQRLLKLFLITGLHTEGGGGALGFPHLGWFGCALGVIGLVQVRQVRSDAPWGSLGWFGFVWFAPSLYALLHIVSITTC